MLFTTPTSSAFQVGNSLSLVDSVTDDASVAERAKRSVPGCQLLFECKMSSASPNTVHNVSNSVTDSVGI